MMERVLPPLAIFVRGRAIPREAVSCWSCDIVADGLNIRPFRRAELRKDGRAGVGVLRWKPIVKRGKELGEPRLREDSRWIWGCPGGGGESDRADFRAALDAEFNGNRWNDLHSTNSAKRAARIRAPKQDPKP